MKTGHKPRMLEDFPRRESLRRLPSHHGANQTLRFRRDRVRYCEMSSPDFREQHAGFCVVKRVPSNQHSVQHYTQTPDIGSLARITAARLQDLWADISRTTMLVFERIVLSIKRKSIFQTFKFYSSSAINKTRCVNKCKIALTCFFLTKGPKPCGRVRLLRAPGIRTRQSGLTRTKRTESNKEQRQQ